MHPTFAALPLGLGLLFAASALASDFEYTVTDLGSFGGMQGGAYAINNSGEIAGYSYGPGSRYEAARRHAFLYSGGVMQDITPAGISDAVAMDINDDGQVTGYMIKPLGTGSAVVLHSSIQSE